MYKKLVPNSQKYLPKGGKLNMYFSPESHPILREKAVQDLMYNPASIVY